MVRLRGITWQAQRGYDPLVATARAFSELHPDITIEWEQQLWGTLIAKQRRELSAGSGYYDFVVYDHPWVGDYAHNHWVVALDELMSPEQARDLAGDADPASLASYRFLDHLWALPIDAACQTVAYRPDLAGAAGAVLPGDWDTLLRLAGAAHRPPSQYAFTNTLSGTGGFLFVLSVAHALGDQPYTGPTRRLDPASGVRGLEILREIWRLSLPSSELRGRRPFELMITEDRAALWPASFPYVTFYGQLGSRRLAMTDMPVVPETGQRTSALGGMGLGIAQASPNREAAWEYAWYVMSQEAQTGLYVQHGGQPGRLSALNGTQINEEHDGFGITLAHALDGCYIRPRYPGWHQVEQQADRIITDYLAERLTPPETVAQLNAAVKGSVRPDWLALT